MRAWLETGNGLKREVGIVLHLGRGRDNDIPLPGKEVSRHHAMICRDRAGWWLIDLDSSNGTWLNDVALKQPRLLRDGDRIRIAAYEFAFSQSGEADPPHRRPVPTEEQTTLPAGEVLYECTRAAALVDKGGVILSESDEFRRLMVEFFSGADHRLPPEAQAWFAGRRSRTWPLVLQRGDRRLSLRRVEAGEAQTMLFTSVEEPAFCDRALEPLGLSRRECDVLRWIAAGKRNEEIGVILSISPRTAEKHVQRLMEKLGVETRVGVVAGVLQRLGVMNRP